jgi:ribosome-associated protein
VAISEGTLRPGQFLKLADLIEAGGEAKALLAAELVDVNGELETRRGRQLVSGDVVTVGAASARVV